jgi:hypothetical protein
MGVGVTRKLVQWLDREKLIHAGLLEQWPKTRLLPYTTARSLQPAHWQGPIPTHVPPVHPVPGTRHPVPGTRIPL